MSAFDPTHIKIGPGTLYAAPLGSVEPTSVTGAWDAAWLELGYTDAGSTFTFGPTTADVTVEEEYYPVDVAIVSYTGDLTFALAETTRQNLAFALNAGIGPSVVAASQGTNGDGSVWQEPPAPGTEQRVMLGWDALPKGDTSPAGVDPFARLIIRKALQTGPDPDGTKGEQQVHVRLQVLDHQASGPRTLPVHRRSKHDVVR
jgi:hypothetical protein